VRDFGGQAGGGQGCPGVRAEDQGGDKLLQKHGAWQAHRRSREYQGKDLINSLID
jgi:hypothetical protein